MENRSKSTDKGRDDIDQHMEVEAEQAKWWNTVDEYLSDDEQTQNITKMNQVALIILRFETILALHRSLLATSNKNAAYIAALQRCITASRSIINTLHKALKGFGAFDGSPGPFGYQSTPLLWPSFTWAVWMSAFIICFAAAEEHLPRDVALRLADRSIQVLQHLALRGTSWPEACIVAIKNLTARLNGASARNSAVGARNTFTAMPSDSAAVSDNRFQPPHHASSEHSATRLHRVSGQATPTNAPTMPPFSYPWAQHPYMAMYPSNFSSSTSGINQSGTSIQEMNVQDHFLAGSGNFLGLARQLSDNPRPSDDITHIFSAEDMSFWMGDTGIGGGL